MTLTELSVLTKRFLAWFIVLVISFYTLKFLFFKARDLYLTLNPSKPPPAEAVFGNLPKLTFNTLKIEGGSLPSYILDTKTGTLPSFPDRIMVYKILTPYPRISAEKEAKTISKSLNFNGLPNKTALTQFTWFDEKNKRDLYINTSTKEIKLETNTNLLSDKLITGLTPSIFDATSKAQSFLSQRGLLNNGLENAEIKTTYVRGDSFGLHETISYVQANMVRVDFFKKIKENETEYRILGENPKDPFISVYMANPAGDENRNSLELTYPFFYYNNKVVLFEEKSNYPIIPVETAWDFVQNGGGNLVYIKKSGQDSFSKFETLKVSRMEIRNVEIAYFETKYPLSFLQPIYVFEGVLITPEKEGGDFYIYIQAVDPKKLEQ